MADDPKTAPAPPAVPGPVAAPKPPPPSPANDMTAAGKRGRQTTDAPMQQAPVQIDPAVIATAVVAAQQQIALHQAQRVATPDMDKTVPHGCYVVEGKVVNAHGDELDMDVEDLEGVETHGPDAPTERVPTRREAEARRSQDRPSDRGA